MPRAGSDDEDHRHEATRPFKFIIYSAKAGEQTPQINPEDVKQMRGAGDDPSTQAWFAGGERVGYDPKARAMAATEDAPLRIFMRREGILAQLDWDSSLVVHKYRA